MNGDIDLKVDPNGPFTIGGGIPLQIIGFFSLMKTAFILIVDGDTTC